MLLVDGLLSRAAERTPEAVALVQGDRAWSYAEVESRVARGARALTESGVRRGDRVICCHENSIEGVTALFATMRAGACAVPLHPAVKPSRLEYVIGHCEARAVLAHEGALAGLPAAPALPGLLRWSNPELEAAIATAPASPPRPAWDPYGARTDVDLGLVIYTSGSTGTPNGVMLPHRALRSSAWAIATYLENRADDVLLLLLPLSFGYGLTQLTTAFEVGARVVLERGFGLPFPIVQAIEQHRVTGLAGVPTVFALLLSLKELPTRDLSSLRYLTNAGAGIAPAMIGRVRAALPHVKFYPMYGQTECTRVTYLPPEQADSNPASVGRGMPNQEHWLVDPETGAIVGPGKGPATGELVVRGSHVMEGYWKDPERTARALRTAPDGRSVALYTKDLFRVDADDNLYFVGRSDEILKCKGQKVAPKEVEDALLTHQGVALAAVVGVPDPVLGDAVTAVVVAHDGVTLNLRELQKHVAARVDDAAVPKYIDVVESLPKNERGKLDKRAIAEAARARHPVKV
ncbi:MAG: AMP-binding protein [Deltaproteobacteria bacterium]|nr:AMP-binding protein [Deltaproteobacteria bacterium]